MLATYVETGIVDVDLLYDPAKAGDDPLRWLTGQLWDCSDVLPGWLRQFAQDEYDDESGTYGGLAQAIRRR